MAMPAWLYHAGPNGLWVFLIVTVILGGLAAFATGRALAQTWRPLWMVPLATALLTCAVRFIHYAVFGELLLSALNFGIDMLVVTASAFIAYRRARTEQMAEQYPWLTATACPVDSVPVPVQ
jgi:L-asparagine transporter-like permease